MKYYFDQEVKEVSNIADKLRRDFPSRSMKSIVKEAERIYFKRKTQPIKSGPPEHVLRNIERVKKAEEERKQQGRSLPKARFVQGGTASSG